MSLERIVRAYCELINLGEFPGRICMLRTSEEEAEVEPPYCYQPVWAESCDLREMLAVVRGWRDVYSEQ